MLALIVSGFVLVLALFCLMARIGLRKFLGYANIVDIMFTILMFMMFHGSFSGIVSGSFSGLFMTLGLWACRKALGYERLQWVRSGRIKGEWKWVRYPAEWNKSLFTVAVQRFA